MTDNTIYTSNKPNLYVQEIIKHDNGQTEFKDIGVTWNKANYSSGTLDDGRKIIVRTQEQRDALFAMRKAQKEQAEAQTVQPEQPNTPQL